MKKAILQVADQGPLESLVIMLRAVGYECYRPDAALLAQLRDLGLNAVFSPEQLRDTMGYEMPFPIPQITSRAMETADLYIDVKAHQCYEIITTRWPNLAGKVLWYRINGGKPEHVIKPSGEDCGDEVNPPCPVLTPNQWYGTIIDDNALNQYGGVGSDSARYWKRSYRCWPPFHRFYEFAFERSNRYGSPVCLLHNAEGWGYQKLIPEVRNLGVRVFGRGSPDGLLGHGTVPSLLRSAKAMVHLKSSDAPGYALYEAMAAGCPVVCTRRLIWRCRMGKLLIPGKTCLVFDRETHDGLSEEDVIDCTREIADHLSALENPTYNRTIGEAGRERLREVVWSSNKSYDVESLREFFRRNFS